MMLESCFFFVRLLFLYVLLFFLMMLHSLFSLCVVYLIRILFFWRCWLESSFFLFFASYELSIDGVGVLVFFLFFAWFCLFLFIVDDVEPVFFKIYFWLMLPESSFSFVCPLCFYFLFVDDVGILVMFFAFSFLLFTFVDDVGIIVFFFLYLLFAFVINVGVLASFSFVLYCLFTFVDYVGILAFHFWPSFLVPFCWLCWSPRCIFLFFLYFCFMVIDDVGVLVLFFPFFLFSFFDDVGVLISLVFSYISFFLMILESSFSFAVIFFTFIFFLLLCWSPLWMFWSLFISYLLFVEDVGVLMFFFFLHVLFIFVDDLGVLISCCLFLDFLFTFLWWCRSPRFHVLHPFCWWTWSLCYMFCFLNLIYLLSMMLESSCSFFLFSLFLFPFCWWCWSPHLCFLIFYLLLVDDVGVLVFIFCCFLQHWFFLLMILESTFVFPLCSI